MEFLKSMLCCSGNKNQPPRPPTPPACVKYKIENVDKLVNHQGSSYRLRRSRDLEIPHMWMTPSKVELGQPTSFHAYFDLKKIHHYNIVWYVGLYREIRKTDYKFVLQNDEKSQTLHILSVDSEMYGRVQCEIRRLDALKKEFLYRIATSHLTVSSYGNSRMAFRDELERRCKKQYKRRFKNLSLNKLEKIRKSGVQN